MLYEVITRGDVRLAEAELVRNDGRVDGEVVDVLNRRGELDRDVRAEVRDEIRNELRDELRRELRDAVRGRDQRSGSYNFV